VIEPVWLIEATLAPDAAESRVPVRAEHLARIVELMEQGAVIEAGALGDMSSSVLIIRAPTEDAALQLCRDDVYTRAGVWVEFRVRVYNRVTSA
jgi:uncharacterized protein YciI